MVDKSIGVALRIVLSERLGNSYENEPDLLTEARQVFAPKKQKTTMPTVGTSLKPKGSHEIFSKESIDTKEAPLAP